MFIVNAWKLQTVVKEAEINVLSLTDFCFAVLQKVMWFFYSFETYDKQRNIYIFQVVLKYRFMPLINLIDNIFKLFLSQIKYVVG